MLRALAVSLLGLALTSTFSIASAASEPFAYPETYEYGTQAVTREEKLSFADYSLGSSGSDRQLFPGYIAVDTGRSPDCKSITQCLINYPHQLQPTDPGFLHVGLTINLNYQTRPGDATCSSGKCFILNPSHLCNAVGPHCVPIHNLRLPLTPCSPTDPRCTSGGFVVDIDISCHPLDFNCGPGGIYVNPRPCQLSKTCPTGSYIPSWIETDISGGFNVTGPLLPDLYYPSIGGGTGEPGYLIDPALKCPASVPECRTGSWIILRPDRECTLGQPGCIGVSQIRNPMYPQLPPSLCPRGGCLIIRVDYSCHPNDFECRGIAVDPLPCTIGSKGCWGGTFQPPPVQQCRPGQPGCVNGILVLPPPTLPPTGPPPPQRPSILVPDLEGSLRCSYIEVDHMRPKSPQMPQVSPPSWGPSQHQLAQSEKAPRTKYPQIPISPPVQRPQENERPPGQAVVPPAPQKPVEPAVEQPEVKPVQPPEPVKPTEPVQAVEQVKPVSNNRFPCSKSDTDPCRGSLVRGWVYGANYWDWSGDHAKPNMPKRTTLGDNYFAQDTILEVVDSWFNNAHYTIWIDGEKAGESDEKELMNNKVSCSGGDDCVKKGFSHAWILIPKGNHKVEVGQTAGFVNGDSDRPYTYAFTQFITRLHKACDRENCPS